MCANGEVNALAAGAVKHLNDSADPVAALAGLITGGVLNYQVGWINVSLKSQLIRAGLQAENSAKGEING